MEHRSGINRKYYAFSSETREGREVIYNNEIRKS